MTEKEWLAAANVEARFVIGGIINRYDDGHLTLAEANHRVAVVIEGLHTRIYDHAFAEGIKNAEIDDDPTEMEMDFDLGDDDDPDTTEEP